MNKKTIKYSEAVTELTGILEGLENEQIEVDELSEKIKRATELIRLCRDKIANTELEVRKIVKEFESVE